MGPAGLPTQHPAAAPPHQGQAPEWQQPLELGRVVRATLLSDATPATPLGYFALKVTASRDKSESGRKQGVFWS